jgi:ferrous iron transport protein A
MNPHRRRPTRAATMPLAFVDSGTKVRIQEILGGHTLLQRLNAMGLVPGTEINVMRNDQGGPLVVTVLDTRVMLGRGMAHKILVR